LPDEIGNLYALKELYVEINPITSLFPVIAQLTQLEILGVLQTGIPESELEKIRQLLPNCKIEEP
jgi:Leucine-rich repeat (LRR) protein